MFVGQTAAGDSNSGGNLALHGGEGSAANGDGGDVIIQGGTGQGFGRSGNVTFKNGAGETKLQLMSFEDVLAISTKEIRLTSEATTMTTVVAQNALKIGVEPNVVVFDTTGEGTVDVDFAEFDVSSQNWTLTTATSAAAIRIGTNARSLVLDTSGSGSLRLEQISDIDLSSSVNSSLTLSHSALALQIRNSSQESPVIAVSTLGSGKFTLNVETVDLSGMNSVEILGAKATSFVITTNAETAWSMRTSDAKKVLNVDTTQDSEKFQVFSNTMELGKDEGETGFTLRRPVHRLLHGTAFNILGQDAPSGSQHPSTPALKGGDVFVKAGRGGENDGNGGNLVLGPGAGQGQGQHGDIDLQDGNGDTRVKISKSSTHFKTATLDLSGQATAIEIDHSSDRGFTIKSGDTHYITIGGRNLHLCPHCTFLTFGNEMGDQEFVINRPPSETGAGNGFLINGQAGFNDGNGGDISIHGGEGGDNLGVGGSVILKPGRGGNQQGDASGSIDLYGCDGMSIQWKCFKRISVNRNTVTLAANTVLSPFSIESGSITLSERERASTYFEIPNSTTETTIALDGATEGQIAIIRNLGKSRTVAGISFVKDAKKLLLFTNTGWEELAGFNPERRRVLREDPMHAHGGGGISQREVEGLKKTIAHLEQAIYTLSQEQNQHSFKSSSSREHSPTTTEYRYHGFRSPLILSGCAVVLAAFALLRSCAMSTSRGNYSQRSLDLKRAQKAEKCLEEMQARLVRLEKKMLVEAHTAVVIPVRVESKVPTL